MERDREGGGIGRGVRERGGGRGRGTTVFLNYVNDYEKSKHFTGYFKIFRLTLCLSIKSQNKVPKVKK